jgi:hypothetical protein
MTCDNDGHVDEDERDLEGPDWDHIQDVVEQRVAELSEGQITECVWTRRKYCAEEDPYTTDEVIAQFEEDIRWMAEEVTTSYPQARNLRWNWQIFPPGDPYDYDFTVYLTLTFEPSM